MTKEQKEELSKQLEELLEGFEAAPPANSSDFQLASHYYGLCIKAVPVLDRAIKTLKGSGEQP